MKDHNISQLLKTFINGNRNEVIDTLEADHPGLTAMFLVVGIHSKRLDRADCNVVCNLLMDRRKAKFLAEEAEKASGPTKTVVLVEVENGFHKDTTIIGPGNIEAIAIDWDQVETDEDMVREGLEKLREAYDAMCWHPDRNTLFLALSRMESVIADNFSEDSDDDEDDTCPECRCMNGDPCGDCGLCCECCTCNDDPYGEDTEVRGDTEPDPEP